jgi:drug/metabolite transporter (DMT)-like permease
METINPWMMAGVLYFGSGIGLLILMIIRKFFWKSKGIALKKSDYSPLAAAVFWGGILGPVFLMFGLSKSSASSASLFLNFEAVFTAILAWLFFHEAFDKKVAAGILFIILGGVALNWSGPLDFQSFIGPLLILAACFCWGLDNNFTGKVSASDPVQIVVIKSLVAGSTNIFLAKLSGAQFPEFNFVIYASILGFVSYGLSLMMFVLGLRYLGASRTGAYFAIAPFFGALLSLFLLKESIGVPLILGTLLMATGVYIHMSGIHKPQMS